MSLDSFFKKGERPNYKTAEGSKSETYVKLNKGYLLAARDVQDLSQLSEVSGNFF